MFNHKAVQDLAFIIESDCIYQDFDLSLYWLQDTTAILHVLDKNPMPLLTVIAQSKSHFLGHYFEVLFSYAIRHLSNLDIILEHKQLFADGKTLGEIDMLVKDKLGEVHHFELAIKFYLQVNAVSMEKDAATQWIGPNKNDSFAKKYQRAKQHQLTMLDTPVAQSMLAEYDTTCLMSEETNRHEINVRDVKRHLLMFGYLYLQLKQPLTDVNDSSSAKKLSVNLAVNPAVNPNSIQGYWLYLDDIDLLKAHFVSAQELRKLNWLSAFKEENDEQEMTSTSEAFFSQFDDFYLNLKQVFILDERPRHFMLKWQHDEVEPQNKRIFIVPNAW